MSTKSPVKLIKKEKPEDREVQTEVEFADNPNRWSKAVRSWVTEFRQDRREETLPAFDSLFK